MILEFEFPRRGRIKYSSAFFGLYWGMIQKMDLLYKQIHLLEESRSETRVKPFKMIIDSCVSWNVAHLLVKMLSQTVLWLFIHMLVAERIRINSPVTHHATWWICRNIYLFWGEK